MHITRSTFPTLSFRFVHTYVAVLFFVFGFYTPMHIGQKEMTNEEGNDAALIPVVIGLAPRRHACTMPVLVCVLLAIHCFLESPT